MIYLVGSIVFTSYLTLCFKFLQRWNINSFHAIVFNYLTCVITGSVFNGSFPIHRESFHEEWFPFALVMGCLFISIFNVVALATRKNGVAVATVAYKLSLVIPFVFSIVLYHEPANWIEITGIATAVVSVIMTCYPDQKTAAAFHHSAFSLAAYGIPVLLFVSSGLLDSFIKYTEQAFMNGTNNNVFLIASFAVAGSIGVLIIIVQLLTGKTNLSYKAVLAGIGIGIPNYFSIWFLVKALKIFPGKSSVILPVNNMGIVLFSAAVSFIVFKEKLSVINRVGIGLALLAIAAIAFG